MVRRDPSESIIDRKEKYIEHTATTDWISLNMLRWEFELPKIDLSIGFNLSFNFLLDFYLAVDLHFPLDSFDYLQFDTNLAIEFGLPEFEIELSIPDFLVDWQPIPKAYYGKTKYNQGVYDPPQILWKDLFRFLWNMRYQTTEKSVPAYRKVSQALKNYLETHKEILSKKGVSSGYIDAMLETLLKVEGKLLHGSYVGFTVVGVAKVMKPIQRRRYKMALGKMRYIDDFKTERTVYTKFPYETQVNYARVNYARVIPREKEYKEKHLRPLSKTLAWKIKFFKQRSSKTPITKGLDVEVRPEIREITKHIPPPKHTLYQRVFFLQKRDKMKWEGGKHQARLQNIIEHVKPILDKYGVHGSFRLGYIAFAKEYVYMHYKPHRRHKQWKRLLTEDDLILKYKRMGCDEHVLREVLNVVKSFKIVVDKETTQKVTM